MVSTLTARVTPWVFAALAVTLLLCAASTAAQNVTASHWNPTPFCSSSAECSAGSSCTCTCQHRYRSASAPASSSSSKPVSAATLSGSWLEDGAACSIRHRPGQAWARCRLGSRCSCSCRSSAPVGGNDTFTYADPEGPQGPGSVTISVLDNDVDPDGTAVRIAPGSVVSLTPGVTVTSVNETEGNITLDIPDGTPSVQLSYIPVDATGQAGGVVSVTGTGTSAASYPAGTCVAGSDCSSTSGHHRPFKCGTKLRCFLSPTASCASKTFANSVGGSHTYCMANFLKNCDNADNAGCNRCAIYRIMKTCAASAAATIWPTPTQKLTESCRYHSASKGYVIVKSRTVDQNSAQKDPETGSNICLMDRHYIVMPTAACTGVDDDNAACTGSASRAYWDGAVRHGYGSNGGDLGFGTTIDWAVMINAPEERGQHQMHIHVAPIAATKDNILKIAKELSQVETDTSKEPTVIRAASKSTRVVAAYFFQDKVIPPAVANYDIYGIAASIHAKYAKKTSVKPNDLSYGVALIPKKGGFIVAAAYGFADVDVMDTTFNNASGWCQAQCTPFH